MRYLKEEVSGGDLDRHYTTVQRGAWMSALRNGIPTEANESLIIVVAFWQRYLKKTDINIQVDRKEKKWGAWKQFKYSKPQNAVHYNQCSAMLMRGCALSSLSSPPPFLHPTPVLPTFRSFSTLRQSRPLYPMPKQIFPAAPECSLVWYTRPFI